MLQGFRQFLMRGNVMDLAVAVIIGAAFINIITALIEGLLDPLIAAIFGEPDLTGVGRFTVNNAEFSVGLLIDATLNFLLVAAAIYFLIVLPINRLAERRSRGQVPEELTLSEDVALLREIRDLLARQHSGSGAAAGDSPRPLQS